MFKNERGPWRVATPRLCVSGQMLLLLVKEIEDGVYLEMNISLITLVHVILRVKDMFIVLSLLFEADLKKIHPFCSIRSNS